MKQIILFSWFLLFIFSCNHKEKTKEKRLSQKTFTDIEINNYVEDSVALFLFDMSIKLEEKNEIDSAISIIKHAIKIEKHAMLFNQLGSLQSYSQQHEAAITTFNQGKKVDSIYWPIYINEARVYLLIKEFNKADLLLLEVINKAQTKYWKSFAHTYLCASYINNDKECSLIKNCYRKALYLKNNSEFSHTLNLLKNKIKQDCN